MFKLDRGVRKCAYILNDTMLHATLQNGDMIAQDATYHRACLTNLYKKASKAQVGDGDISDDERKIHGIAFAELISLIEERVENAGNIIPVFKSSDLRNYYQQTLQHLGVTLETKIHSARLKNRIMNHFDDMSAHSEGKELVLVFNHDIGDAISSAASIDFYDEGVILQRAANIIRRYIIINRFVFYVCVAFLSYLRENGSCPTF